MEEQHGAITAALAWTLAPNVAPFGLFKDYRSLALTSDEVCLGLLRIWH
jgi:hypothetical protein